MIVENLKDINSPTLLGIINELLFECEHIVVLDFYHNKNLIINDLMLGTNYKFMYSGDIDIIFELSNDKDYPIKMSYETTYSHSRYELDCIQLELFNERRL